MTEIETTTEANAADGESKEAKFVRLAVHRMNALKNRVRQVKNLARYPHTDEQAERIVGAFKEFADDVEKAFRPSAATKKEDFTF